MKHQFKKIAKRLFAVLFFSVFALVLAMWGFAVRSLAIKIGVPQFQQPAPQGRATPEPAVDPISNPKGEAVIQAFVGASTSGIFNPGANDTVWSIAVQADGKIVIGGDFTTVGGMTRNHIARLYSDGSVDPNFNPGANGRVSQIAIQADGGILAAGDFTVLGGGSYTRIGRLNSNGSLDTSFWNAAPNDSVYALTLQGDNIVIGGRFTSVAGSSTSLSRNFIAWLDSKGDVVDAIDPSTFNPGANNSVFALAAQPDNKVIVGGAFTMLGGGGTGTSTRNRIGRLNADGRLDATFNPGANNSVFAALRQSDGKIVLGGAFTGLGGGTGTTTRNRIGRLNSDGSVDTGFNPGANVEILCLAQQADGRLLVGGNFTTLGGGGTGTTIHNFIARLNADGSIDSGFNAGANGGLAAVTPIPNGTILVGGAFSTLGVGGGVNSRNRIGLLNADGTVNLAVFPLNDNLANAQVISGSSGLVYGVNIAGTKEQNEPNHGGHPAHVSVWYRWQAPFSGSVNFTTFGSSFDTILAAYTGNSVNALTPVLNGSNDDNTNTDNAEGHTLTSSITFSAVAGNTYYVAVDGSGGRTGAITLGWGPEASIGGEVPGRGCEVTIILDGDDSRAIVFPPTFAGGTYNFQHLHVGGRYTVRRYETHQHSLVFPLGTFDPLMSSVTNANDPGGCPVGATSANGGVFRSNGVGLAGIAVSIAGTVTRNLVTNSGGGYAFPDLPVNGTYTVTPSSALFNFSPPSQTFTGGSDIFLPDFVASDSVQISGQARRVDGVPISGATVALGNTTVTVSTDTDGYYSVMVPGGGTYTLTATKAGVTFIQPALLTNVTTNQKNVDFIAATVTISGHLRNVNGRGLSGERVDLSGSDTQSQTTDVNGAFSFTVGSGGTYDIAPNDSRVQTWSPANSIHHANLTQNVSTDDFEARFPSFTVAGVIKNGSGANLSGVTVRLTGTIISNGQKQVNASYLTHADGSYTSDQLNILGDYTFAPDTPFSVSGTTYGSFNPPNRAYNVPCFLIPTATCDPNSSTNNYLGADFTAIAAPTPVVTVGVSPLSVNEDGATNLVYTFSRTDATSALTVNFSVGGAATFNSDYTQSGATTFTSTIGTIAFAAGETSKTVTVDPTSDTTVEPNETVVLTVTPGTGYNIGSPGSATGTITNDDTDVTVAVSPSAVNEDGATNLVYTFTRNGITNASLVVSFSVGGTATLNGDYTQSGATTFTASAGTIAFGVGETSKTVTLDPISDSTVEPNETVILTLTSGTGYNVASPNSATGTITNDDTDVSVAVSPSAVNEDGATNLVYTFTRNGIATGAITVNFSVGGTATLNTDYTQSGAITFTSTVGTIAFASGETSKTVTVDPTSDTTVEPDETVVLTVTSGAGYTVGSPSSATGTITNDDATLAVQFSTSAYAVTEGTPHVDVTINRTGDSTGAASVNFATSDSASSQSCSVKNGFASSRCDYEARFATVKFAAGETSKTLSILIDDDSYLEGPETFSVNLTNPSGATLGAISTATVTINDNELANGPNPINTVNFFVQMQYLDFLNREPDPPGLAFWIGNINNCTPQPSCTDSARVSTSGAFYLSIEFQQTGYLVERLYKTSYGDAIGISTLPPVGTHALAVPIVRLNEFLLDTQQIGQGVVVGQTGYETVLENNKQAFMTDFVQRTRFTNAFPTSLTPAQFVDALNQNAGNVLSASERTTAINLFGGAGNTSNQTARAQALRQVAEDQDLYNAEASRAFVLMQYFGYLRRNPNDPQDTDYSGYEFWLNKMNAFNGDYLKAEMVKAFITTPEYIQRFGP